MQKIIEQYERDDIIEKCQSPYNSPAFWNPKKDDTGGTMDQLNYKKLNAECEILNFPISRIDEIINSLHGSKYFTTVDLK